MNNGEGIALPHKLDTQIRSSLSHVQIFKNIILDVQT